MQIYNAIFISFFILVFAGCVTTKIPSKSEYRIKTNVDLSNSEVKSCQSKVVKVSKAFSSSSLVSKNMSYALGNSKQHVYSKSLWAENPNIVITSEFVKLMRDTKLFRSVQLSKSRSRSDFILEVSIEDFMQYFNADSTGSFASVSINLTLIDTRTNKVLASELFNSNVNVDSLNAIGGVKGLSIGLSNVLNDTNKWISGVCK